jgi:iron complex outermembrane receptor protein
LPETSKDWEVGLRSRLFNRALTFNVTAFDTKYRNFQAQGIEVAPDGTSNFRLRNVGRLRTRGVEAELSTRLGNLSLNASGAYVDARITQFTGASCYPLQTAAQGCVGSPGRQDLTGARPPQAPVWKGNFDAEYAHDIGTSELQAVLGGSVSYQSKTNFALARDPETRQPGYATVNLSLGVRAADRQWQVTAFVNNLTDKQYFANLQNLAGQFGNQIAVNALLPRDFRRYAGIRAGINF